MPTSTLLADIALVVTAVAFMVWYVFAWRRLLLAKRPKLLLDLRGDRTIEL